MKKWVIFLSFLLILTFSASAKSADDFNFQASVNDREVTLTWDNVFYRLCVEEEVKCEGTEVMKCQDNQWVNTESCQYKCENGQCIDEVPTEDSNNQNLNLGSGEGLEANPDETTPVTPDNEGVNNIDNSISSATTEAIVNVKGGFLSKIFYSIVNAFRKIFGLNTIGAAAPQAEEYAIYKYTDTSNEGEVIAKGSPSEFNCKEKCSYTYTENNDGTYTYSISSLEYGNIASQSSKTEPFEFISENICNGDNPCEEGYECIEGSCVIKEPELECDENNPCGEEFECVNGECVEIVGCRSDEDCNVGEECNIETNECILINIPANDTNLTIIDETNLTTNQSDLTNLDDIIEGGGTTENSEDYSNNQIDTTNQEQASQTGASEEGSSQQGSSTGIVDEDVVGVTGYEIPKISFLTYILVSFAILIIGIIIIYLYLFKLKKYKKDDVIAWVEHSRELLSNGYDLEHIKRELEKSNLPKDFIKIVIKKLR